MRITKTFLLVLFAVAFSFQCCEQKKTVERKQLTSKEIEEILIAKNKSSLRLEASQIDAFVKKQKWEVTTTGTGLRYLLYQDSIGSILPKIGQLAKINFSISLLNGDTCYANKQTSFRIEQSDIESGLHEGIKLMTVGDKAKFILPSHLAHGLLGDNNKIPRKSSIVYDVELVELR